MDTQYECDNAFPNLKCVPEMFFLEKGLALVVINTMGRPILLITT